MKNIDKLNKKKKIITIIEISLIILFIILFYIACKGPFLPTINGLCAFISLISIITAIILNNKRKNIKQQIYDISTISKAIEDSKK